MIPPAATNPEDTPMNGMTLKAALITNLLLALAVVGSGCASPPTPPTDATMGGSGGATQQATIQPCATSGDTPTVTYSARPPAHGTMSMGTVDVTVTDLAGNLIFTVVILPSTADSVPQLSLVDGFTAKAVRSSDFAGSYLVGLDCRKPA